MSEKIKDGGPAFPIDMNKIGYTEIKYTGMSLRDYFAAKAMQSYILTISDKNSDDYEIEKELGEEDDEPATTHIAEWAYIVADAMLKAREK